MQSTTFHVAALANALLLALPAGWCNQLGHPQAHLAAPVRQSCCHPASEGQKSPVGPAAPVAQCCCSQPVVAPEKAAGPTDLAADAWPLFVVDPLDHLGQPALATPVVVPLSAALRLHALLGVWRC